MISADEHKKLLAQIEELEKNSVNYFDVEKEFFLITSDNLADVQTRLYGYSIQRSGIYEDDNLTPEAIAGLDGRGCYVYVENKDGKITIKQDLNGCWGIYLFRHGDYFALSNSFFRLLDYVKFRYPLTVNRDYCHYLLFMSYASFSCSETAINEIQLVDRNATIMIDKAAKNLQIDIIGLNDHTLSLESEEGIAALDRWFEFWSNLLSNVAQHTQFFQADLSGGFDSRISIVPLLHSDINLKNIRFCSTIGNAHTYKNDYEIASKIAAHYGFKLNQPLPARKFLNYSLSDVFNLDFYAKQTFSTVATFSLSKGLDKIYWLNGLGGEGIRANFDRSPNKYRESMARIWKNKTDLRALSSKIFDSVETILQSGFLAIQNKFNLKDPDSADITLYYPRDTVDRHHCGKIMMFSYLVGNVKLSPIFDPELYSLKLNTQVCSDAKLLIAMIFSRYEPDLLNFPFDSNHSIAPETIEYAKKINERFPRRVKSHSSDVGGGVFSSAVA